MNRNIRMLYICIWLDVLLLINFKFSVQLFAQSSPNYRVEKSVMAQNGMIFQTGNYQINCVIGQPAAIGVNTSVNYVVNNGVYSFQQISTSITDSTKVFTPQRFDLYQNYPNPFNPSTTIHYELPKTVLVNISIFNIKGQKIKILENRLQPPGFHSLQWYGKDEQNQCVPSGIYICQINAGEFRKSIKVMLVK